MMVSFVHSFPDQVTGAFGGWAGMLLFVSAFFAFFFDLEKGKIPNLMILILWAAGLILSLKGQSLSFFFGGSLLPVLSLWILFHFRMMGAGDIKLLSAFGGLAGAEGIFRIFAGSILTGGILAFFLMAADASEGERLASFLTFVRSRLTGRRESYLKQGKGKEKIHFTAAILMGVILYLGGVT